MALFGSVTRRELFGLGPLAAEDVEPSPISAPRSSRRRPNILRPRALVALAVLAFVGWLGCGARHTRVTSPGESVTPVAEGAPTSPAIATAGPAPTTTSEPAGDGTPRDPLPNAKPIKITMYHVAAQPCPDTPQVAMPKCGGGSIATVSTAFKKSAAMQGTSKLCDGRLVGVQQVNPLCFVVVDPKYPWGLTASGKPATPFRSIGVDTKFYPHGTWWYVHALDGVALPYPEQGKHHDGCLRADDVGPGVRGPDHIDLFVGPKDAMTPLIPAIAAPTMAPGEGRCTGKIAFD